MLILIQAQGCKKLRIQVVHILYSQSTTTTQVGNGIINSCRIVGLTPQQQMRIQGSESQAGTEPEMMLVQNHPEQIGIKNVTRIMGFILVIASLPSK